MEQTLLATNGSGLVRATRDASGAWQAETLLEGDDVRCLAADPLNGDVVYAGTQGEGVLRSDDRGQTWVRAGMAGRIVKSLAASPHELGVTRRAHRPRFLDEARDEDKRSRP